MLENLKVRNTKFGDTSVPISNHSTVGELKKKYVGSVGDGN
jgi:hypothetical protein